MGSLSITPSWNRTHLQWEMANRYRWKTWCPRRRSNDAALAFSGPPASEHRVAAGVYTTTSRIQSPVSICVHGVERTRAHTWIQLAIGRVESSPASLHKCYLASSTNHIQTCKQIAA